MVNNLERILAEVEVRKERQRNCSHNFVLQTWALRYGFSVFRCFDCKLVCVPMYHGRRNVVLSPNCKKCTRTKFCVGARS